MVQWLRICLPLRGARVQSLVRELRFHIPFGQNNKSNIVINSIKTLKKKKKKEMQRGGWLFVNVQAEPIHLQPQVNQSLRIFPRAL